MQIAPAKLKRKKGQSLVEFLFVSIFFIFMLALTYQTVIAFTIHQYIYYVAFMSARAYQAAGPTPEDQRQRAFDTMRAYIPSAALTSVGSPPAGQRLLDLPDDASSGIIFENFGKAGEVDSVFIPVPKPGVDHGPGAVIDGTNHQDDNWVGIKIRVPFVTLPLGSNMRRDFGYLTLSAYSYLGREVTKKECRDFFDKFSGTGANPLDMEDQGC